MRKKLRLLFVVLLYACQGDELLSGLDSDLIREKVKEQNLYIYVPPSYKNSTGRYPVVYMLDGQSVFTGGWGAEKTLEKLVRENKVPEMIIVGLGSSKNRTSQYVPYDDDWVRTDFGPYQPQAAAFADFIVKEVVPYVDQKFRTLADRENRAIIGSSFGGLFAMWMGMHHETTFSMIGALSPSFWVADYKILAEAEPFAKKEVKVWFDMGTLEWNYYVPLIDLLRNKGHVYGETVAYYEDVGGRHDVAAWAGRIQYPLILFKGNHATKRTSFVIHTEVIKSLSSARFFLRLNPVVEMDNGLKYSLSTTAKYTLLNPEAGRVNKDGSFEFSATKDLEVEIEYQDLKQKLTVRYNEIEAIKRKL